MAKDHAHKFIHAAQNDPELRAKIKAHIDEGKIEQVAKDHGFHFSADDLHAAMEEKWSSSEDPNFCFFCF